MSARLLGMLLLTIPRQGSITMASTIIVGDGPAGLSAALFLAKNGQEVTVLVQDKTPMHYAKILNYLGILEITGSEFQKIAKEQVSAFGAILSDSPATAIEKVQGSFKVTSEDGTVRQADYLVLAEGKGADLAEIMGLQKTEHGVASDEDGRTSIDRLYVVGRATRPNRSQAIIAAGHGAAAALDILASEAGKDFLDYDSVD